MRPPNKTKSTNRRYQASSRWRSDQSIQRAGCGPACPVLRTREAVWQSVRQNRRILRASQTFEPPAESLGQQAIFLADMRAFWCRQAHTVTIPMVVKLPKLFLFAGPPSLPKPQNLSSIADRPFLRGYSPLSSRIFCLCRRSRSPEAIFSPRSLHPKIPFPDGAALLEIGAPYLADLVHANHPHQPFPAD